MFKKLIGTGAAFLLPLLLAASLSQSPQEVGVVFGQVTDPETGDPLSHIRVSIPEEGLGAITSSQGRFVLRGIPFGQTTMLLEHHCFHSVAVKVELSSGVKERRVNMGMPYDYETEAQTGCDRRIGGNEAGNS